MTISCWEQPSATFIMSPALSFRRMLPSRSRTFCVPDSVWRLGKFNPQYLDGPCMMSRAIVEIMPIFGWPLLMLATGWIHVEFLWVDSFQGGILGYSLSHGGLQEGPHIYGGIDGGGSCASFPILFLGLRPICCYFHQWPYRLQEFYLLLSVFKIELVIIGLLLYFKWGKLCLVFFV